MAEMDYKATIERLAAGKRAHRARGERVEGRWPYGEHPEHRFDAEREIVRRIRQLRTEGVSSYAIAKQLNTEGMRTRYGAEFKTQTIQNILRKAESQ